MKKPSSSLVENVAKFSSKLIQAENAATNLPAGPEKELELKKIESIKQNIHFLRRQTKYSVETNTDYKETAIQAYTNLAQFASLFLNNEKLPSVEQIQEVVRISQEKINKLTSNNDQ